MLGGTMRQVGVLAAAGIFALDNNVERLAEDHANAQRLAQGLAGLGLEVEPVQTNMVFVRVPPDCGPALASHLESCGVAALVHPPRLRLVTHLDVDAAGIDRAVGAFAGFFRRAQAAAE
jgi:threonine aldolase